MRVQSYIRGSEGLIPVEVDLTLAPGLPQFHFIGLPDTALKESSLRIRSAIRAQGFQVPQTQAVLVHLRPTHVRKTSHGLDLAVAAALLWETEQLAKPEGGARPVLYGELTLQGEVLQPDDIDDLGDEAGGVVTGRGDARRFATWQIEELKQLVTPAVVQAQARESWVRPRASAKKFSRASARIAEVVAAGEHPLLLAGPAGSGKSTLASSIAAWLEEPGEETESVRRLWRVGPQRLVWRPVLQPHHSITPLAMIGGGSQLWPGEITRAHTGVLIMDELLQFHPTIQESLREPVEQGCISIVRGGHAKTFPARVLLLATTNLCDCGNFVPRRAKSSQCRCSLKVRRKTLARLSGPFVDRFHVVALSDEWDGDDEVSAETIAARVDRAIRFRREMRTQSVPNARLLPEAVVLSEFQQETLKKIGGRSRRRRDAVVRVARTLADLRESGEISDTDLNEAIELSWRSHRLIEEWHEGQ